jgi:uroporphyrinogen-III synthase
LLRTAQITLDCRSCIGLEVYRKDMPPPVDWIFFSSPSGFRLFSEHFGLPRDTRIAVLGEGTERALETMGLTADFIPDSTDPQTAIEQFCKEIGRDDRVLIARSDISLQRFYGQLSELQLVDWPFYTNRPTPPTQKFQGDVLIFTSPSNVRAYFSKFQLMPHQRAVGIGGATFKALVELTPGPVRQSKAPTEAEMWKAAAL